MKLHFISLVISVDCYFSLHIKKFGCTNLSVKVVFYSVQVLILTFVLVSLTSAFKLMYKCNS